MSIEKLLKNSTIKKTSTLDKSLVFNPGDMVATNLPILNLALSGDINGGFLPGMIQIVGPSKHFKSNLALLMLSAYLNKRKDSVCLFYDSEYGSKAAYFKSFGIDPERVVHSPILNVEQFKFDIMAQIEGLSEKDNVIIVVDSVGNLASKKEVDDAIKQNSAADMSRAKALKSLFRMVTPLLQDKGITFVVINHIYMEQCLAGETLIKTEFGVKAIKDITIQDKVFALNGLQQVTAVYTPQDLYSSDKKFMKITFDDGTFVKCTNNHKFLDSNKEWVSAENFVLGTQLY